jgi:Membrane dipeptidase (Peptidase family M19)
MIVDLAHASHATVADVLAMATRPVVFSHGGVQATCKVNRNPTDEEITGVAKTGGVIGIGKGQSAPLIRRTRREPLPMSAISWALITSGLARTSTVRQPRALTREPGRHCYSSPLEYRLFGDRHTEGHGRQHLACRARWNRPALGRVPR